VIFPASGDDVNPFVGQATDGFMLRATFFSLLMIVGVGPNGARQRALGELMEGLLKKLPADIAMMHPKGFATLFGHRSNATEALHGAGIPSSYQL